jgi:hypothetical protein
VALLLHPVSDAMEDRLRTKWRSYGWRAEGFPLLKQYAILLHRMGRTGDAIAVIRQQLAHTPPTAHAQLHECYLLEFLLRPAEGNGVPESMAKIFHGDRDGSCELAALRLLLAWADNAPRRRALAEFLRLLPPPVPEKKMTHRLQASLQLALRQEEWRRAGDLTLRLLALSPAAPQRTALQRLWLSLTLERDRPDFQGIIENLKREEFSDCNRALLQALAGHFHGSGDNALAAKFLDELGDVADDDGLNILRIRVGMALGKWEWVLAIFRHLPPPLALSLFPEANVPIVHSRLAAEWVGWLREVFFSPALAAELRPPWGCALVEGALELGNVGGARTFLGAVRGQEEEEGLATFFGTNGARIALLALRLALADGIGEQEAVDRLRTGWPESAESAESYFLRARHWRDSNRRSQAIGEMRDYLARHGGGDGGDGQRVPEALLFLAHLLAGENSHSALRALESIWQGHPHSAYARRARLYAGDLLRELHQFDAAAQVYQALANDFPAAVEAPFAELSLAKCQLAAATDAGLHSALLLLEKLSAIGAEDPNFRIEVDYTLAFALARSGDHRRRQKLLWKIWQFALTADNFSQLNDSGKFWLHAAGRDLLALLDPAIDDRAIQLIQRMLPALGGRDLPAPEQGAGIAENFTADGTGQAQDITGNVRQVRHVEEGMQD